MQNKNNNEEKKCWSKKSEKSKKPIRCGVIVPKQCVSAIIGRSGSVIKEIQTKTNTYIKIEKNKDLESQHVTITVQGDEMEYIMLAKCLINEKVENHKKIKTCKMIFLSNSQHAQISREAEYLQRVSGAKLSFISNLRKGMILFYNLCLVFLTNSLYYNLLHMLGDIKEQKLLIKGTTEEIEKATSEIEKIYLKKEDSNKTNYDNLDTSMSSMQINKLL